MTLAGQIRDCPGIQESDRRKALLEIRRMQTDAAYAWKVSYTPSGLRTAFVWEYTDAGDQFWSRIQNALHAQQKRNTL